MNDKHTLKGYIAISISMLFWGFSFVWSKQLLNAGFPVFTIVFFRLLIASVIFVTLFCIQHKLEKIAKEDRKLFFWLALFEPFLYVIGEEYGLQQVSASFASVIIGLIPIVVSVTMYFAEDEKLTWTLLLGTIVSIIGIGVMTFGPDSQVVFNLKGLLWLMLALVSAGGYSVLLAKLVRKYSPVTVTTYQNLLALPFYVPFVCIFDLRHWGAIDWSMQSLINLTCLAILCSAGAYMLYSYAAKHISITKLSVFTNAIPIVTICGAALLGQEALTLQKFAGIAIVVVGVVLSQMRTPLRVEN